MIKYDDIKLARGTKGGVTLSVKDAPHVVFRIY